MPRIQDADLAAALRRRFQLKGGASIDTLAPEIVPVVVAEILEQEGVWREAAGHESSAPGGAGVFSFVRLQNPVGSGVLAETLQFTCNPDQGSVVRLSLIGVIAGPGAHQGEWADRRLAGFPVSMIIPGTVTPAIVGEKIAHVAFPDFTSRDFGFHPYRVILPPGSAIDIVAETSNVRMNASWRWRERTLRPED